MITLGRAYIFRATVQDYDGPVVDIVIVHAQGYTQALEVLQTNCPGVLSNPTVTFIGTRE